MRTFTWVFYMHIQVFTDRISEHTVMHIEAHKQFDDMPCLPPSNINFPIEVATMTGKMFITETRLALSEMMVHIQAHGEMSASDVKWMFEKNNWHFPKEKDLEKVIELGKEMELAMEIALNRETEEKE